MSVDWSSLRTAEGDASAVPALMHELISGDSFASERAYRALNDLVTRDGELFDAALYVSEWLVGELRAGRTKHAAPALWLLAEIMSCGREPDTVVSWNGQPASLVDSVQHVIEAGLEVYAGFLQASDIAVRRAATLLLSVFEGRASDAGAALAQALDIARDEADRESLREAIARLRATSPTDSASAGLPSVSLDDPHLQAIIRRRELAQASGAAPRGLGPAGRLRQSMISWIMRRLGA